MKPEFAYLKEAVTKEITEYLIQDFGLNISEALDVVYESETFLKLSNPDTGLYFRGSKYVYSYLLDELKTGTLEKRTALQTTPMIVAESEEEYKISGNNQ